MPEESSAIITMILASVFLAALIANPSVANLMNRKVDRKAVAKKIEKLGCY